MSNYLKAIFAGGCFWCTESTFAKVSGVIEVLPGYIGDEAYNANYDAAYKNIIYERDNKLIDEINKPRCIRSPV